MDKIDIIDTLAKSAKLDINEIDDITENSTVNRVNKHELLKTNDSGCLGLLYIISGELRAYILSEEGKEVTLYRLHSDDYCVLTSSCVLNQIEFDVFVEAITPTEFLQINTLAVARVNKSNIFFENFILKQTLERFNDVMWSMEQILFKSMDQRLATFLLDEVNKTGNLELKLTHEQIAKYVASAREVVSRTLKYFEGEKILEVKRGKIIIKNKKSLLKLI